MKETMFAAKAILKNGTEFWLCKDTNYYWSHNFMEAQIWRCDEEYTQFFIISLRENLPPSEITNEMERLDLVGFTETTRTRI